MEVSDNTIMAMGAEPVFLVGILRNLHSMDGDRSCMINTDVRDNVMEGNGADGIFVTLSDRGEQQR